MQSNTPDGLTTCLLSTTCTTSANDVTSPYPIQRTVSRTESKGVLSICNPPSADAASPNVIKNIFKKLAPRHRRSITSHCRCTDQMLFNAGAEAERSPQATPRTISRMESKGVPSTPPSTDATSPNGITSPFKKLAQKCRRGSAAEVADVLITFKAHVTARRYVPPATIEPGMSAYVRHEPGNAKDSNALQVSLATLRHVQTRPVGWMKLAPIFLLGASADETT